MPGDLTVPQACAEVRADCAWTDLDRFGNGLGDGQVVAFEMAEYGRRVSGWQQSG